MNSMVSPRPVIEEKEPGGVVEFYNGVPHLIRPTTIAPPSSPSKDLVILSPRKRAGQAVRFQRLMWLLLAIGLAIAIPLFVVFQVQKESAKFEFESAIPMESFSTSEFVEYLSTTLNTPLASFSVEEVSSENGRTKLVVRLSGTVSDGNNAEGLWRLLGGYGQMSKFKIIGFSRGLGSFKDICPSGSFGFDCKKCYGCGSMSCVDGALGTGRCVCDAGWAGSMENFRGNLSQGVCVSMSTETLELGPVPVGHTSIKYFTISSIGAEAVEVSRISTRKSSEKGFSVSVVGAGLPRRLEPGHYIVVKTSFSPKSANSESISVEVEINGDSTRNLELIGHACDSATSCSADFNSFPVIARINSGCYYDYVDWLNTPWGYDKYFIGGRDFESNVSSDPLLRFERRFSNSMTFEGYRLLVSPNSRFLVELQFAEFVATKAGDVVFDVQSGTQVLKGIDIFSLTGERGKVYSLNVNAVSDASGNLFIGFKPTAGNYAKVNAIIIKQLSRTLDSSTRKVGKYDYGQALYKSYMFYDAMKSGELDVRRFAWRSNSCFNCFYQRNGKRLDLSKGYYEAGNYMKLSFHTAFVVTQLAWNVLLFPEGHQAVGQMDQALKAIRWGSDYLLATRVDENTFVGQVGFSEIDFQYYGPAELWETYNEFREIEYITPANPASEILGEAAAALAATSIVFKNVDPSYSRKCLDEAKVFWKAATTNQGTFMNSKSKLFRDHAKLYPSSDYVDELAWSSLWIYYASGEVSYLGSAKQFYSRGFNLYGGWAYSWDEKTAALHVLFAQVDPDRSNLTRYDFLARNFFDQWLPGPLRSVSHTTGGLGQRSPWASLRYAANTAFLCFAYSKVMRERNMDPSYVLALEKYGESQINYILGDSGRSYMVGFGQNYPQFIHHKGTYNSILRWDTRGEDVDVIREDFQSKARPQEHILYGALVGGPAVGDSYSNSRGDYRQTEVSIDYNAGLTGALAFLSEKYTSTPISDCDLDLGWNYKPGLVRPDTIYNVNCRS